jgi:TonB family protein
MSIHFPSVECNSWCVALAAIVMCSNPLPRTAAAQDVARRGALSGVVRDSAAGTGIAGAEVRIEGTAVRAITNEQGAFRFPDGAPAASTLRVRRLGFVPRAVTLSAERSAERSDSLVEIVLTPSIEHLPPVVVSAERAKYSGRLAGYYERLERRSIGQFITRADLERERPSQLTDMIQRTPGVNLVRGRPGMLRIRLRGRDCSPLIWLDGAALTLGDVDLDAFSPPSIEGIELYLSASSAPSRYQSPRGKSECGTILLWSRGPDTDPRLGGSDVDPVVLDDLVATLSVFTADQVDSPAVLLSSPILSVTYPHSLRASGVSGSVLAEFVVDTTGQVESEYVGVVSSTHPLFSEAVRVAVGGALFRPAVRKGRRVRQLVRLPFQFVAPGRERP